MSTGNRETGTAYPHRSSRLSGFDYADGDRAFFLTLCAHDRSSPFANESLAVGVIEALLYQRRAGRAKVYAYVLMPDHLHCVLSPSGGADLISVVREFKTYTTRLAWGHAIVGPLWQRGFYDHVVRGDESLKKICEYVLANPVRRGLVGEVGEWPFSGIPDPFPV